MYDTFGIEVIEVNFFCYCYQKSVNSQKFAKCSREQTDDMTNHLPSGIFGSNFSLLSCPDRPPVYSFKWKLFSFIYFTVLKDQEEVNDDLSICVLNLLVV